MEKNERHEAFGPVPAGAWKQKIQADLKGGDYNALLTWTSPEGITVKPFYTEDDLPDRAGASAGLHPEQWGIGYVLDPGQEGSAARAGEALENGVDSLFLEVSGRTGPADLEAFLSLQGPKYADLANLDEAWIRAGAGAEAPGFLWLADPIGTLAATGNWTRGMETDLDLLGQLGDRAGGRGHIAIHAGRYQNAGANRVQELAYALAHGHEYLLKAESDPRLRPMLEKPVFLLAMGNEYFFEIAKTRALRALWRLLARSHGYSGACVVIARPTRRNKTLYDYNTNMLRTTMECMAAVLGGADLVCNSPYDSLYHLPNAFGDRIGRNQLLLLRHEGYFSRVSNAADGAYYIEALTDQLGSRALELFKTLEKGGGFLRQLKEHKIQKKIRESARQEQEAFDQGRLVLVGSNRYANADDRMKGELQVDPFRPVRREKTLIEPILPGRLSETYEQKRLRDE